MVGNLLKSGLNIGSPLFESGVYKKLLKKE